MRPMRHPSATVRPLAVAVLLASALGACGRDGAVVADGDTGGTVVLAMSVEPSSLLPPLVGSDHEQAIAEVVYDRLADIGPTLSATSDAGFTPRLASAWQWAPDSMSIAFTLDPRARWHDGRPVVSEDVRRSFALYTDPRVESRNATLLANIDSVSAPDASTAVFWFKRRSPLQFYDATYHLFVMPAHHLEGVEPAELAAVPLARAPVGTGRFRFVRWVSGERVELVADTANYRTRPPLDRLLYVFAADFGAATVKLFTGEADFFISLREENLEEARRTPSVRVLAYPALRYQAVALNHRAPGNVARPHPVLGDRDVRRALTMATDRERIVQAVFDTLGRVAIAPAPRAFLPPDSVFRTIPFDRDGAAALLDSLGWITGPDGVRARGGTRMRLELLVPSSSVNRDRMAVLLQDQWRAVGVEVVLQRLEVPALLERIRDGRFDGFMGGWNTSPGLVGLRQVWTTRGIGGEGDNFGRYVNPVFDASVDTVLTAFDPTVAQRSLVRAIQTIIDDAAAIWLVEDATLAGISARIDPGPLPATGWWQGLTQWRIPADRRIARDRLGLTSAP